MSNLNNYLRQHKDISELINYLKETINRGKITEKAKDLSLKLNNLAGKLKVHLVSEDKYLYPTLKNSSDITVKNLAIRFENEMGGLSDTFMLYKDKYNIASKILGNENEFKKDTLNILRALELRMSKEENELYIKL